MAKSLLIPSEKRSTIAENQPVMVAGGFMWKISDYTMENLISCPLRRGEVLRTFPRGAFQHVLFDFDGTISLLRQGWQAIMKPFMVEMICGTTAPTAAVIGMVEDYIEESTGVQTIVQMTELVRLVTNAGHVNSSEVRSALEYKRLYNRRLMQLVSARLDDLKQGRIEVHEVTVEGVIDFLELLSSSGATLYVFSGTDVQDVREEAAAIGVAKYFSEIWGALDSIEAYSKEKVLRELMSEKDLRGSEVLVIGDGPVEIQNAKVAGCVSLGVASDETAGRGWDPKKRERLRSAGADVLIPDFREYARLGELFLG